MKSCFAACIVVLTLFFSYGNTLYARQWIGNGPYSKNIRTVTHSPSTPSTIFAGAFGWGMFKSTDNGATWQNNKTGMTNTYARAILALSDSVIYIGTNDGVFKSINGGATWALNLTTLNSVRSIAYDQSMNTLYAATYGTGLYKSTNQGTSWTSLTVTDPVSSQTLVHQRAVTVFGRDSVYVGGAISDIVSGGALFKSIDGGTTWIQVQRGTGIRSSVMSIAINPNNTPNALIIGTAAKGVYQSINGGTNWTNLDGTTLNDHAINAVAYTSAQYYAGSDSGGLFYYRTIGTPDWSTGSGLPGIQAVINAVKVHALNSQIIYLGTEGKGVYKSTNSGVAWFTSNSGMLGTAGRVVRLNGNGTLMLGTEFGDGIWRSSNQSASWTKVDSLSTSNTITSFGITSNPQLMYAGAYGSGVYKSTDAGLQWIITDSSTINHNVRTLSVIPSNSNIVFAGTGDGVYKTTNGGSSWFTANSGMPLHASIRSMAMDQSNTNVVYVGTDSTYLYKTTNGGTTWTNYTNANGFLVQDIFIRTITIDNNFQNILYVGSDSGRIYKSTNGASSWNVLAKLATTKSVRAIIQHPQYRRVFFAATFGSGIFVSTDSCAHWSQMNAGLPDQEIYSLEADNAASLNLYAGTGANGVFHSTYSYTNHPPVLSSIGNKSVYMNQTLQFVVNANDPDVEIPSLSTSSLPPGAAFIDSANGHGLFTWSPDSTELGTYSVTFRTTDQALVDTQRITISVLDPGQSTIVETHEEDGWNMVSVPLYVNDKSKTTLFPTSISSAYAFQAGYVFSDSLYHGQGYWLKFPSLQDVQLFGSIITSDTVDVNAKWNIVGSITSPIPVTNVTPVFPVTVVSSFYGFSLNGGYGAADTLYPGKAYWVKVSQPGKLILNSSGPHTIH